MSELQEAIERLQRLTSLDFNLFEYSYERRDADWATVQAALGEEFCLHESWEMRAGSWNVCCDCGHAWAEGAPVAATLKGAV